MVTQGPVVRRLAELPRSERMDFLAGIVEMKFKDALLMTEQDELPLDENYFTLGLNSLRAVEIKSGLEELLGRELDTATLFSQPTVRQLLDHLADEVLGDLFPSAAAAAPAQPDTQGAIVADVLKRIYGN
jgi:acyl carrier protein